MRKYFVPVEYAVRRETGPAWQIPERVIHNHELVLMCQGKMRITIRQEEFLLKSGNLVYFRPNVPHSLKSNPDDPAVFYGIHFSLPGESLPLKEISFFEGFRKWEPLLNELILLWNRKKFLDDWEMDLHFSRFLMELFRENENPGTPGVRRAISWIHQHTDRPVTIEELCEISGMKKSALISHFEQVTGLTPVRYSLSLRLEMSKILLINGEYSVKEAAFRCGFSDEFYFSRMFRREFGQPPSEFRKNTGGNFA